MRCCVVDRVNVVDCRSITLVARRRTLIDAEQASFSVKITLAFAFFLLLLLLLLSARSSSRQGQTRSLSPAVEPASFTRCTKADVQVLVLFLIFSFYLEIPRWKYRFEIEEPCSSIGNILHYIVRRKDKISRSIQVFNVSIIICSMIQVNKRFAILIISIELFHFIYVQFFLIFHSKSYLNYTEKKMKKCFVEKHYGSHKWHLWNIIAYSVCFLSKYNEISFEKDKKIRYNSFCVNGCARDSTLILYRDGL